MGKLVAYIYISRRERERERESTSTFCIMQNRAKVMRATETPTTRDWWLIGDRYGCSVA